MNRRLSVLIALVLAAGCCSNSRQPVDPFFGRTTVEPPRTGSISGQSSDLYYAGPRPATPAPVSGQPSRAAATYAGTTPAGRSALPGASAPTTLPTYRNAQPPNYAYGAVAPLDNGTGSRSGERIPPPATMIRPAGVSAGTSQQPAQSLPAQAPAKPASSPASNSPPTIPAVPTRPLSGASSQTPAVVSASPVVRTLQPRPKDAGLTPSYAPFPAYGAPTPANGSAAPASERAIEITELPLPKQRAETASGDRGARLASATAGEDNPVRAAVVNQPEERGAQPQEKTDQPQEQPAASTGPYSHDPGYNRLRGKLEYSQSNRQWKLRYLPVDGSTDDFGGSVVIANPAVLSGFERGQVVEVEGQLKQQDPPSDGFAPDYQVSRIRRLAS